MGCSNTKVAKSEKSYKQLAESTPSSRKEEAAEMNEGYVATMQFLAKVPLFQKLPKHQHPILADACEIRKFAAGASIVKQGDLGVDLYIIKEGEATVIVEGSGEVAKLGVGNYFGENALLKEEPRMATVKALTAMETLRMTRDKFQDLGLHQYITFPNRKAVGGADARSCPVKAPSPKSQKDIEDIVAAMKKNDNLQTISSLSDQRLKDLASLAWTEKICKGNQVITQGDLVANYFYIVKSGMFEILLRNKDAGPDATSLENIMAARRVSTVVGTIQAGGSFGELALLYSAPRAATIVAMEESVVWVIDRGNFKKMLKDNASEKADVFVKYLASVEILKSLSTCERRTLAEAMVEVRFSKNDVVIKQGDPGSTFYILCEGEASVIKDGIEQTKYKASSATKTAPYFGERALLNKEPRAATVKITSETAVAMMLDKESFTLLLGSLEDRFRKQAQQPACMACFTFCSNRAGSRSNPRNDTERMKMVKESAGHGTSAARPKVRRVDLRKIGLLGSGAFGVVELFEHMKTKETYAMKTISKGFIVEMGLQDSVMNERSILMMTDSPFVIALYETYNSSQRLHFLLEPALGGELHSTYIRKDFYGSVKHAKYYVGCIVYAFEHMHERRIIYRDLKPENLLMNEKGHLKVTDMGLSKFCVGKTFTTCGTPDYFAPEIISSTGHNHAVDWWALGVLIYEFLTGHPPFEAPQPMQTYNKVLKGFHRIQPPPTVDPVALSLITDILQKEPAQRLPCKPGGTENLKDHAWFRGFDWVALKNLSMEPPYVPQVKSKRDIANFWARMADIPEEIPYTDDGSGWDKEFASGA